MHSITSLIWSVRPHLSAGVFSHPSSERQTCFISARGRAAMGRCFALLRLPRLRRRIKTTKGRGKAGGPSANPCCCRKLSEQIVSMLHRDISGFSHPAPVSGPEGQSCKGTRPVLIYAPHPPPMGISEPRKMPRLAYLFQSDPRRTFQDLPYALTLQLEETRNFLKASKPLRRCDSADGSTASPPFRVIFSERIKSIHVATSAVFCTWRQLAVPRADPAAVPHRCLFILCILHQRPLIACRRLLVIPLAEAHPPNSLSPLFEQHVPRARRSGSRRQRATAMIQTTERRSARLRVSHTVSLVGK